MAEMMEYDLTSVIGAYLDRHLVFPMLEFLSEKKVAGWVCEREERELLIYCPSKHHNGYKQAYCGDNSIKSAPHGA